jgi:DNA polymerase-3 subunit gamma/tau
VQGINVRTQIPADKPLVKSPSKTTVKLNDLLKVKSTVETATQVLEAKVEANEPFTAEQLHLTWMDFAEQRKKFQAEYHLLCQPTEIRGNHIIIQLLSTVQETMLNNFKSDLIAYLRENLKNNSILVIGELKETEEKQMRYTPRDKFEYLLEKNPVLKTLRDRLGLDPDF